MSFFLIKNFYVSFLLLVFLLDIEFLVLTFSFIFLHIFYGLLAIVKDYVHKKELVVYLKFILRLLLLNILLILIELLF
uniref:succinate dehydrogenase subunit 4 n=1 Tax=Palisada intermedia TaxID=397057 RepID=UPI00286B18E3|nr:succinate dehydrogenase subunit 4 [Palisada intermedia]WMC20781.1 succinate dehydrogenase subunit 4 [Palisada intermedia]